VSLDPEKLLFIFVIAVLVLGPERLPQMARTMGRVLAEVRKYTSGFQSEVGKVLAEPRAIIDAAVREADIRPDIRRANNGAAAPGTNGTSSNDTLSNDTSFNDTSFNDTSFNDTSFNDTSFKGSASDNGSANGDAWAGSNFAAQADETEPPGPGFSAAAPGGYSGNGAAAAARAQRGRADLSPQTAEGAPDDPALN
jgi:Sec-independent protein translocase protein TatA